MSSIAKVPIFVPALLLLIAFAFAHGADPSRKPGAVVRTDALAQTITNSPHLAPLQDWAVTTLDRFRAQRLHLAGGCIYYPFSRFKLATNEIPAFILQEWRGEPEVSVVTTTNG
jgi:hypothetical protein